MIDKRYMQSCIVDFFEDKKLNKNSYYRAWYDKYEDGEKVYNFINEYYRDTPTLDELPLGQKLYHIVNDVDYLPDLKFISYKRGYVKGGVSFSGKSIASFIDRLKDGIFEDGISMPPDETMLRLSDYVQRAAYTSLLNDKDLIHNISKHTEGIEDIKYKFASMCNDSIYCICGDYCSFKNRNTFFLNKTCSKKRCISDVLSTIGKDRDLSYLQSGDVKERRVKSRRGYHHSETTKSKISTSNKKTWTKDKRDKLTKKNRARGIYKKMSDVMRNKILTGEFTPNTNNRYSNKKLYSELTGLNNYRSSWEVMFHENNPHLDYELIRIPYTYDNKERVYIVDFCDQVNKVLYEVKPREFVNQPLNQSKFEAARLWCRENDYAFKIITKEDLCEKI
jgi:hypothetical protein